MTNKAWDYFMIPLTLLFKFLYKCFRGLVSYCFPVFTFPHFNVSTSSRFSVFPFLPLNVLTSIRFHVSPSQRFNILTSERFRRVTLIALSLLFMIAFSNIAFAQNTEKPKTNPIRKKNFSVGVNYPGVNVGYKTSNYQFELRGQKDNDIKIYGARASHLFYPFKGGNIYWGADAFKVEFEDAIVEGDGNMVGIFAGTQVYIGEHIALNIDAGPYRISLEDDVSGIETDNIQFVINATINVYFY